MGSGIIQKQAHYIRQIALESKYWLKVPIRAVAYVTGNCNYHCSHCYASDFLRDPLSPSDYKNIFKKLSNWGVFIKEGFGRMENVRKIMEGRYPNPHSYISSKIKRY